MATFCTIDEERDTPTPTIFVSSISLLKRSKSYPYELRPIPEEMPVKSFSHPSSPRFPLKRQNTSFCLIKN